MTKSEFLNALSKELSALSECDRLRSLHYFEEMIADRMEEGCSEEEAVAAMGNPREIAENILAEEFAERETVPNEKKKYTVPLWLAILLAVIAAPVWIPVVVTFIVTVICIYLIPWCLILGLFATAITCFFGGLAGLILSPLFLVAAPFALILGFGLSFVAIGLGILLIFPAVLFTKWLAKGTAWCFRKLSALWQGRKAK